VTPLIGQTLRFAFTFLSQLVNEDDMANLPVEGREDEIRTNPV
jgi:hypothetical protein